MLNEMASHISFFGVFLTGAVYLLALALQRRFKSPLLNPLLLACVIIIGLLLLCGIDYNTFLYGRLGANGLYDGTGAIMFQNLLTPTTVCLAIPLYEKLRYLKKYPLAILGGITVGASTCMAGVLVLAKLFALDHRQYVTLLPKSITTAIGMGISEELGGLVSVTVAAIVITGIFGNVVSAGVMKLLRITHPVAQGVAIGTASHAIGTARARELGEVQEAMSGLAIAVCGLITVVLAPIFAKIPF